MNKKGTMSYEELRIYSIAKIQQTIDEGLGKLTREELDIPKRSNGKKVMDGWGRYLRQVLQMEINQNAASEAEELMKGVDKETCNKLSGSEFKDYFAPKLFDYFNQHTLPMLVQRMDEFVAKIKHMNING